MDIGIHFWIGLGIFIIGIIFGYFVGIESNEDFLNDWRDDDDLL